MSARPLLKLTFSKPKVEQVSKPPTPSPTQTVPKLKLKIGAKPTVPPAAAPLAQKPKTKASPSIDRNNPPRAGPSRKRTRESGNHGAGIDSSVTGSVNGSSAVKRIKFSTRPAPSLRLKSKGEPPLRPKGVGYDSEASDTEIDPALEEQFILRMQPGEDCDYLRQAVEEKRFGPRGQGGADISFKSLTRDGRRATVTIRGRIYAASLVDLPCILDGLKSWDKRGWYKAADICQMLLVMGRVASEDEARNYPLPKDVDETSFQFAHGLTPPLRWVRKRRFRKRISNRTIEAVELEVARLIKEDMEAIKPPDFEVIDYAQYMRETSMMQSEEEEGYNLAEGEYDDEQDAEGEAEELVPESYIDPLKQGTQDDFEDDLAAEMEAALAAHAEAGSAPASTAADGSHTADASQDIDLDAEGDVDLDAETPNTKPLTAGETSGDDDEESEASLQQDDDEDLDEDALEQQRQLQEQREEIAELEALVRAETSKWDQMANPILKSKLGKRVQSLKQELELKKVSIGEGGVDG